MKEVLTRLYFYLFIFLCSSMVSPFSAILPLFIVMVMKLSIPQKFICTRILRDSFPKHGIEQELPTIVVEMFIYSKSLILLNRLLGVIPACLYEDMCIPGVTVGTAYLCAERCWAGKPRATTAVVVAGLTRGG